MRKYDRTLMSLAFSTAGDSYCKRRQVGAVIARDGRPVVNGYNGTMEGSDNDCEDMINGALYTKPSVIHAEANAIIFAAKHGIRLDGCSIYITTSPCINCSTLIHGAGIKEVIYSKLYKDTSGITLLEKNGVDCRQLIEVM